MIAVDFEWKSHVQKISVKPGPKQYGFYKRMGKTFFRNYHRELKNGKGLSFADILAWRIRKVERQMAESFRKCLADSFYSELVEGT